MNTNRKLSVEIANRFNRAGRCVGNDWIVVDRTDRRSNVLARFGEDEGAARAFAASGGAA